MDSIFTRDGAAWVPSAAALGPWGASLHGGAPAALLAHVLDALEAAPGPLARVTLDLFRPVPAAPLEVSVRPLRIGRRLAVQEAILSAGDRELVRAVSVHGDEITLPEPVDPPACPLPGMEEVEETTLAGSVRSEGGPSLPGADGLHHRLLVRRGAGTPGSGAGSAWMRLPLDLAPGVPLTPVAHLAACSDFANGLAQRVQLTGDGGIGFINADISLHLLRAPTEKRIAMVARNEAHPGGRALVSAECWQADGLVARVVQTALVMPRN
ncbi:MAG: thioesterase family protein [Pseudomonadales bacterium]|jgi:acyl-coenzyme A thioesterase PaaI-like protein|nr:thioesterase family protein [Pseudomonadales bacterium]